MKIFDHKEFPESAIDPKDRPYYIGRNRGSNCTGLQFVSFEDRINIYPMNSRGTTRACMMQVPLDEEYLEWMIEILQKAKRLARAKGEEEESLEASPPSLPRLAVVMEGGLVQAVVSDQPEMVPLHDLLVIDYDTDGSSPEELTGVPQGDGSTSKAYVRRDGVSQAGIDLEETARLLDAEDLRKGFTTGLPFGTAAS